MVEHEYKAKYHSSYEEQITKARACRLRLLQPAEFTSESRIMENSTQSSRSSKQLQATLDDLHGAIRRRAEEIYVRNGKISGNDVQNWIQAEQEILREAAERSSRRTAVVVNVNGARYVGEYSTESAAGYTPGEFAAGDPVPVRFEGECMYVKRPNGRELKTTLVKQ